MLAAEPLPLDPARARAEEAEARPPKRRSALPLAILGSLGVHLLPLVLLFDWTIGAAELDQPIPVQLVIAEPAPDPVPPPQFEPPKQPLGRLASDDMGDPEAKEKEPGETQVAALPVPKPAPPDLPTALDQPEPPDAAVLPEEAPPPPPPKPPVKQAAVARPPPAAPRTQMHGEVPGPSATRDAYLAYCMTLIRRHFDMLPPSFLAGRRGTTEVKMTVLDDGTIARVSIAVRSPHADIDTRIEQMVATVGHFPPLPQWYQGPEINLILRVSYPDGL